MAFDSKRAASIRKALKRERAKRDGGTYTTPFDKDQLNAALQNVEVRLQQSRASLNAAIESAAPGAFSLSDKNLLSAEVMNEFQLRDFGRSR